MPATSASDASYSTPATVPAFHVALAVVLGVVGLALCITVGVLVARERRRHQARARSTPSAPVEGVKTPADAWASMATFEAAVRRDEKAVYACADEKASAPKPSKRISVPHIQIQVTTSSSWVIEQDLTELWAAARRDASAPQRDSVPFDIGSLKGRS